MKQDAILSYFLLLAVMPFVGNGILEPGVTPDQMRGIVVFCALFTVAAFAGFVCLVTFYLGWLHPIRHRLFL